MKSGTNVMCCLAAAALAAVTALFFAAEPAPKSVIVQGTDAASAAELVRSVGGVVTHELGVIRAVGAQLAPRQLEALRDLRGVRRIYDNQRVTVTASNNGNANANANGGSNHPYTDYPTLVGADDLHVEGITGAGVTVAVLDTGHALQGSVNRNTQNQFRLLAHYDAGMDADLGITNSDLSGHGGHVTAIILNSVTGSGTGKYNGIAPDADLVVVKAFDADGRGTYADVIRGLDFVVANKDVYGIRVLNLSFSGPPLSHYWDDPLNQAVMGAWQAGIVVVAAAGNGGPEAMTIGVPGNVPYVVTAGAMSDNYTPEDGTDDKLTSFSAAGPTYEAFVKPEVVAPGGHMVSLMLNESQLAVEHPEFHDGGAYFTMSGTSQSAAVVSGVTALMLQADPALTPDDVKCRLMDAARPAVDGNGNLAYSVFQQGAGLVNAYDAVYSTASACANQGLDVDYDLAGVEHYAGRARQAEDGSFYLDGLEGYTWSGAFLWNEVYLWNGAFLWNEAYLSNGAFLWNEVYLWNGAFLWNEAYLSNGAFLWNETLTEPMSINTWVEQE